MQKLVLSYLVNYYQKSIHKLYTYLLLSTYLGNGPIMP